MLGSGYAEKIFHPESDHFLLPSPDRSEGSVTDGMRLGVTYVGSCHLPESC